jgi:hypothetical protein
MERFLGFRCGMRRGRFIRTDWFHILHFRHLTFIHTAFSEPKHSSQKQLTEPAFEFVCVSGTVGSARAPRARSATKSAVAAGAARNTKRNAAAAMPKSLRPVVKIEDGVGGSQAEFGLQEVQEAGAGRAVQRRRVGEAGDAAWDHPMRCRCFG